MTAKTRTPEPPGHLSRDAAAWFRSVVDDYEMEPHHVRLLALAATAWDRAEEARSHIAVHGTTYTDRFGQPKARPEVAIERDSRIGFARLLRELGLESAPAGAPRPPGLKR